MVTETQSNEAYYANYYSNIPVGDRSDFLLVLRIVLGGSDIRWLKRFAAWRCVPATRKLRNHEVEKLKYLTDNEQWRKTLQLIQKLTTI